MGSLNFTVHKDQVVVEVNAEGDPYGHDGCDSSDCHWSPDSHETQYLDIEAATELRRALDAAIEEAQRNATPGVDARHGGRRR